jgi:hypothetical protein
VRVGRYAMDCAAMDIGLDEISDKMTDVSREKAVCIRDHRKRSREQELADSKASAV